jgi:hypothetical protein
MKKVLLTLCGAVLLMALLTAPALAGPLWQSDLVCDVDGDDDFSDLSPQRPYAVIKPTTGDLWVSNIFGLPPNTNFLCELDCKFNDFADAPCGRTDANGKLAAQIIKGFASEVLGRCAGVSFDLLRLDTAVQVCVDGF